MVNQARIVKRLMAAAALLAAPVIALGPAPSASAISLTTTSGTPGTVTIPGPMMMGSDVQIETGSGFADALRIDTTGLSVGASPSTDRPQSVQVRVDEQAMSGGWTTFSGLTLPAGRADGSTPAGFSQIGLLAPWAGQDYRVVYTITWTDAATGAAIAQATVEPSSDGDTLCLATKVACTSLGDRIRA